MKRTCMYMRTTMIWALAALCSLVLSTTVWAYELTSPGSSTSEPVSQIVVSGAAAAREAEARAAGTNNVGPGVSTRVMAPPETSRKGASLGIFTTTGYCPGECCGGGSGKTYSGTVPQANHTISADLTKFPIGTKLMINDIIYTVEDIGSNVRDNLIDIFYNTHEEAMEHGLKKEEVFAVIED